MSISRSLTARRLYAALTVLCLLYIVLLWPDSPATAPSADRSLSFAWNQDNYWQQLEASFNLIRTGGCGGLVVREDSALAQLGGLVERIDSGLISPEAPIFREAETTLFHAGVMLAACPNRAPQFLEMFSRLREGIKGQSLHWDMNSRPARDCIYRLLYGGRMAIEEVMLQASKGLISETVFGTDEPSATPTSTIHGVTIHSGDILVSRGGAPTSALIARGNDYPGNFSHVALVFVDDTSHVVSIIESHIEKGVALATVDDYLRDTKLRIMVLRPRADLPPLVVDPMLPHKAAVHALRRARSEHTPYDFAMDAGEHSRLFCSEVVSEAYGKVGLNLWRGLSTISSHGARNWLAAFGVRNFTTQEPSDLEYDPHLRVVAEWRDYETLYKDRVDNAVVDIMLENADSGAVLDYSHYLLPIARILKAYSWSLNQFNVAGPVPEGMTATAALQNKWFSARHGEIKAGVLSLSEQFQRDHGYPPPYWELIKLARQANSRLLADREQQP